MNFLRYCFKHPTRWLMAHGADGSANGSNCHCYSLMVTSTIAQLYVVIKCWINNMNCLGKYTPYQQENIEFDWIVIFSETISDAKMMQTIFKMASILLHDNFAFENYKPKILFLGSLPIQNRLQVIYDRIMSCRHLFKLEMAHGKLGWGAIEFKYSSIKFEIEINIDLFYCCLQRRPSKMWISVEYHNWLKCKVRRWNDQQPQTKHKTKVSIY